MVQLFACALQRRFGDFRPPPQLYAFSVYLANLLCPYKAFVLKLSFLVWFLRVCYQNYADFDVFLWSGCVGRICRILLCKLWVISGFIVRYGDSPVVWYLFNNILFSIWLILIFPCRLKLLDGCLSYQAWYYLLWCSTISRIKDSVYNHKVFSYKTLYLYYPRFKTG